MSELKITREVVSASNEKQLIGHMIMSTPFLVTMSKILDPTVLKASHSQVVAEWCLRHYQTYNVAPDKDIQNIYMQYRNGVDDTIADTIMQFLTNLSEHYQPITNIDFSIKQATQYVSLRKLEKYQEKFALALTNKDVSECERLIANYAKIDNLGSSSVDVLNCAGRVENAFNQIQAPILEFPEALGKLIGPISYGDFIGIVAPAKAGKSYFLQLAAIQGIVSGLKVYMASLEMSEAEMLVRIFCNLYARPEHDENLLFPYFYKDTDKPDEKYKIGYDREERKGLKLTSEEVETFYKEYKMYYPHGGFRLKSYPSKKTSWSDIVRDIESEQYYNDFDPDIVLLDYPSLLKMSHKGEKRIDIDDLFAEIRGWLLENQKIGIVVHQGNRDSFDSNMVKATNISESISVIQHLTRCIGLSNTPKERELGITRYSLLAGRKGTHYADQVITLGNLAIGSPAYTSRWLSECDYKIDEGKGETR